MTTAAHVIVLTHNGQDILERNLPSIVAACSADGRLHRLTVVDNDSVDGTPQWLAAHYPQVEVVRRPNHYLFSLNEVVRRSPCRHVILLNDDLTVKEDFIAPLLEHFADPAVFSVGCKVMDASGAKVLTARVEGAFSHGILTPIHYVEQLLEPDEAGARPTFYTPGGGSAFDRDKFTALGGFDRLYRPIYMEDVDLCYRAQKRGWRCVYEPRAVVYAEESTTMKRQASDTRLLQLRFRNTLLFTWKNVTDWRILLMSLRTVLFYLRTWGRGEAWRISAIFSALGRLPEAWMKRPPRRPGSVSDRDLTVRVYE